VKAKANLKAAYSRSKATASTLVTEAQKLGYASVDLYSEDTAGHTLDDLLKRDDIKAVVIVLPILVQPDIIRRCFAAGKHVLTEKPLAKDVQTGRLLIEDYKKLYASKGIIFSVAEQFVKLLKDLNELDDAAIVKFVGAGKFDEVAAALATLNNVPTELMARVLEGPRSDLVLIPCKSAGLDWLAVETILRHRPVAQPIGEKSIWQANLDYGRLSRETAQRTIRFWQLHNRIEK